VRGIIPRFLVTVLTLFALFALAGFQITGRTAATRLLGRLGSALIEVELWLPAHREELELRAGERPQGIIQASDIPVVTSLPSSQILDAPELLQDRLVAAMGRSLYDNGTDALQGDAGPVKLGEDEPVRLATNLLSKHAHGLWTAALALSGILLAGLCLDFIRAGRTPLPSLLLGAVLACIGAGGGWLMATAAGTVLESGVDKEVMRIARDGAWLGLRDSLAVAVACTGLLLISRTAGWERGGYLPSSEWRHERSQRAQAEYSVTDSYRR
jgi:hypothetical protein